MEQQRATRRLAQVLGHVAASEDLSSHVPHLFPMNCSSTLNSMMGRCDNKILFARQGSASQAYHMQQQQQKQQKQQYIKPNSDLVNSRQQDKRHLSSSCSQKNFRQPLFSRQAQKVSKFSNLKTSPPQFARSQIYEKQASAPISNGKLEWAPRMDAIDMGHFYVVTIELAGVKISDIHVEVDHQTLTVTGQRSTVNCTTNIHNLKFKKKEISQGPYRVVWPLPTNVNKNLVSAKFMDGILHVTLPKL
ncbi:hypothetical protein LUZ60_013872 [Juncus effusus]|nr:hypothetical protein LUZ60_013872 [Juncus effusus]